MNCKILICINFISLNSANPYCVLSQPKGPIHWTEDKKDQKSKGKMDLDTKQI